MQRPATASSDYWVLSDTDLHLLLTAVQREIARHERRYPVAHGLPPEGGHIIGLAQLLTNLRHEQVRRISSGGAE